MYKIRCISVGYNNRWTERTHDEKNKPKKKKKQLNRFSAYN